MLNGTQPRSLRASSGDILKAERGVASCGGRLVTARPGGPRAPPPRPYRPAARGSPHGSEGDLQPRTESNLPAVEGRGGPKETEARPRGPKPPRWSAERRASRVMGRKAPRKRLAYRVMIRPTGVPPSTRTSLGAPPTLFPGERSNDANPGRGKHAAGTRWAV